MNAVRASAPADKTDEMLTSQFRSSAICMDNSCSGMMVRMPCRQSTVVGTSRVLDTCDLVSSSPVLHITKGLPYKHNQSMQPMRGEASGDGLGTCSRQVTSALTSTLQT